MNALGMVEVFGFTTSICCADIAAKAADVKIIALDKNKPAAGDDATVPLIMVVKMEGTVSAVEMAVDAASKHAKDKDLFVSSYIIPRPETDTEKMANINEVGRDRWRGDVLLKEKDETPIKQQIKNEEPKEEAPDKITEENKLEKEEKSSEVQPVKRSRGRPPKPKNQGGLNS